MRISDWSSDVCSSDLLIAAADAFQAVLVVLSFVVEPRRSAQVYNVYNADIGASILGTKASDLVCEEGHLEEMGGAFRAGRIIMPAVEDEPVVGHRADGLGGFEVVVLEPVGQRRPDRSEEHTSELQSLMRNSYAVFCLK